MTVTDTSLSVVALMVLRVVVLSILRQPKCVHWDWTLMQKKIRTPHLSVGGAFRVCSCFVRTSVSHRSCVIPPVVAVASLIVTIAFVDDIALLSAKPLHPRATILQRIRLSAIPLC
jgi:hypothetical protein